MWWIKAKALRELRAEKMWSVEKLSSVSGVSERTIFDLEKRDRSVRNVTLADLTKALGADPKDLARFVGDPDGGKPAPAAKPSSAPPSAPAAPLPPLRAYGPGVTELPRLTRLEELVAIEATHPPRPALSRPEGPVPPLTAKLYQDVFTAYRVHEGRVAYVRGVVLSQRGMSAEQAAMCGTKSGTGARFHFVFEVAPGHEIGVTVHTTSARDTAALQDRLNKSAVALVKVVVAPEDAVEKGLGFEFFMSNTKTLRPWGLEVLAVLDADADASEQIVAGAKGESRRLRRK